ncbi:hypothetical protein BGZ52_004861, partial [Haplosporangium bisporale]
MKVVSIANYIEKRGGFKTGDRVVLLFPNGVEFAATVYACWFLGLVPIPVQMPEPSRLHEDIGLLMGLLAELKISNLIGNQATEELMKQKTTMIHVKANIGPRQDTSLPTVFNVSKAPKMTKNLGKESGYSAPPSNSLLRTAPAMVFVHYSTDMRRTLVKVSHSALMAQCRAQKVQCRFKTGRPILSCWKNFSSLGLLYSCALGVYVGAPTAMIQYSDFSASPHIYFEALEKHGIRDALLSHAMLEQAISVPESITPMSFNFIGVKNFLVGSEGRPRIDISHGIERRFAQSRLEKTVINTMFGHMINPMVTTRAYMNIEPVRLHLSLKSLRRGTVQITTEQEDPTGVWVEDSGIPVCGTTVAIVNPETREICLSREIGEIWVSSDANVQSYQGAAREHGSRSLSNASPLSVEASNGVDKSGEPASPSDLNSRYNVTIAGGDARISYVRTGEIGFLWNYSKESFNGGKPTSLLFVLGSIGETFEVNGLMHFPKDIEATVEKSHPNIAPNGSIVFQADQAVVCVVQVRQPDVTIVNMTMSVMHQVLEKHQFMPDVIAMVGEGVLTKNRYGEKQRGKMLSLFMSAKMPLLYIHYPRGSLPKSVPEQMQPAPMTPLMGRGSGAPNHMPSSSNSQTEKPSSIRSNRSTTSRTSMASMRSVRSFIGTMAVIVGLALLGAVGLFVSTMDTPDGYNFKSVKDRYNNPNRGNDPADQNVHLQGPSNIQWRDAGQPDLTGQPLSKNPGRRPKTVQKVIEDAKGFYQRIVKQRHENLAANHYGTTSFDPWFVLMYWWWYFPPSFVCPHDIQRVGPLSDGGKWICGMSLYEEKPRSKCVLYSFGVNHETRFEGEMLDRTDCEIWAYDASVSEMGP